jgi:preprotein translocase subunit YajC
MAVNPKDKKELQKNWEGAEESGGGDLPDGTYQFKIKGARFHMTEKGKPQFKTKIEVVGGDEEFQGKELEVNDNLETSENMGWFKRKLRRLNIEVPESVDEITDGDVADAMEGKVFEGQVKTKNDFMNVYVNRLIVDGEGKGSHEEEEDDDDDKKGKNKKDESSNEIEEGSRVTWGGGKEGEVIEIDEDDEEARVRKDDDTVVRVALNKLELVEKEEEEKEEEEESDKKGKKNSEELELPSADEVEDMKMPAVKEALEELGFDVDEIENARGVLRGFCALAEDPKAKLNLDEVKPLASALEVKLTKGDSLKDQSKAIGKAVAERLG